MIENLMATLPPPSNEDVTLAWGGVRALDLSGFHIYAAAVRKVFIDYERLKEEKK